MQRYSGAITVGAAFLALTGQALPTATDMAGDFCSRLASNIGIDEPETKDGRTVWTARALNFGQRFLFGGTAVTAVDVEAPDATTIKEYKQAKAMCIPADESAVCELVGPINFVLVWKGNRTVTPIREGETATVVVKGLKTSCETGGSAT